MKRAISVFIHFVVFSVKISVITIIILIWQVHWTYSIIYTYKWALDVL